MPQEQLNSLDLATKARLIALATTEEEKTSIEDFGSMLLEQRAQAKAAAAEASKNDPVKYEQACRVIDYTFSFEIIETAAALQASMQQEERPCNRQPQNSYGSSVVPVGSSRAGLPTSKREEKREIRPSNNEIRDSTRFQYAGHTAPKRSSRGNKQGCPGCIML